MEQQKISDPKAAPDLRTQSLLLIADGVFLAARILLWQTQNPFEPPDTLPPDLDSEFSLMQARFEASGLLLPAFPIKQEQIGRSSGESGVHLSS
jgi:hypothetical protein